MAYINPQFEVDQQREARRDGFNNQLVQGITNAANMFEENRRRALGEKRKQFDTAMTFAGQGIAPTEQESTELKETGFSQSLLDRYSPIAEEARKRKLEIEGSKNAEALYKAEQLKKPIQERDDYIKSIDSAKARSQIYEGRLGKQEQMKIEAEQRKLENEKKQGLQKAAIPDFEIADPNIVPSSQDSEAVKKYNAANKSFMQVGSRAADRVGKLTPSDRTGLTNNWKLLQQDLTEMRLQAKELANLGVLNGPDLKLVDETLGGISLVELNRLGPEAAKERIQTAIETANQKLVNAATARGYAPKGAAKKPQLSEEDNAAIQWAKQNPNDPRSSAILQLHGAK